MGLREPLDQLVTLMARGGVRLNAGMRFVDDDELRAGAQEVRPPPIRLDVIQRDHGEGIDLEDRLVGPQPPLQARRRPGAHDLRLYVELGGKLLLPLFAEMRWA